MRLTVVDSLQGVLQSPGRDRGSVGIAERMAPRGRGKVLYTLIRERSKEIGRRKTAQRHSLKLQLGRPSGAVLDP